MNINVRIIEHGQQRYETCGDWFFIRPSAAEEEYLQILVSDTGNPLYNLLIAYHEQIEAILCRARGIKEEDVTAFDVMFENERILGIHQEHDEPGNDPRAPYHKEHVYATLKERELCNELGLDWSKYEEKLYSL